MLWNRDFKSFSVVVLWHGEETLSLNPLRQVLGVSRMNAAIRCLTLVLPLVLAGYSAADDEIAQSKLLRDGMNLTAERAEQLEQRLEKQPEDIEARITLLAYYWRDRSPAGRQRHAEHCLYLMSTVPDAPVFRSPEAMVSSMNGPEAFEKAESLWRRQVEAHPDNARVLGNAAAFFLIDNRRQAEEYLRSAREIEPEEAQWAERLGHLYKLDLGSLRGEERTETAKKALAEFEQALELNGDGLYRFYHLDSVADCALEASELDKASAYAEELLKLSAEEQFNWNNGNGIHHGNLILGRVALREKRVEEAKRRLIAAGRTKGSPQLNSFGPNMALARELLQVGEPEVVLSYFALCKKFWPREELREWAETVRDGGTPDFGANLFY